MIMPTSGSSFAARKFIVPAFSPIFHFHPELELTLIERGTGRRLVGDVMEDFDAGDLVLYGSNLPHLYRSLPSGKTADDGMSESLVIQFKYDFLGPGVPDQPEFFRITRLFDRSLRGIAFGIKTTRRTAPRLRALFASEGMDRLLMFLSILQDLSQATDGRSIASPTYSIERKLIDSERIQRVCRHIQTAFDRPFGLSDAARLANLSESAFSSLFRRRTGMRFIQFLNEVRIAHACKLLMETDWTVLEIALACGYNNISNFNRRFLERKRLTPSAFRDNIRDAIPLS